MIKNELQYKVTKSQADKFEQALEELHKRKSRRAKRDPLLVKAFEDSIRSQLDELREEIKEYERLRRSGTRTLELRSIDELPTVLIQARIATGLTHKELADLLNLKEQQVQRYEATEYASASVSRISEVANALGLKMTRRALLEPGSAKPAHTTARKGKATTSRASAKKGTSTRTAAGQKGR